MVDRSKASTRMRVVNLRAVSSSEGGEKTKGPSQDVVGIALGFRMVISEQAEIWTVRGILRDGTVSKDDIGDLSFTLIPGDMEPATAVTGFIAPTPPYALAMNEDQVWQQLRGLVLQLGYDQEGFYASVGIGGKHAYWEDYHRDGR